jgi:hypothetical protein
MEIRRDFDLLLTVDDVLRGEGTDPKVVRQRRPSLVKAATLALQEGSVILHPVALSNKLKVSEFRHERIIFQDGTEIASPFTAHHLAGAEEIAFIVCTIGPELEIHSSAHMENDPLYALALDGLGNSAVERISEQVCGQIGKQAQTRGLSASAPISPGLPEWPVEIGQPQIFSMLNPSQIGITLSSSGMMVPKKSISFILGIGQKMTQIDLCELCSLRERCQYRHA